MTKFRIGDRIAAIPNSNKADLYHSGSTTGTVVCVERHIGVIMDNPKAGFERTIWVDPSWIEHFHIYDSPLWKALG